MIANANAADGITVWGSLQCPYYVHKALMPFFGLPARKLRVVQTETGGGFGGKEEYPSMLAGARGAARAEIRQAREDDLRSRRGHGGHHQAPSLAHAPSHGGHARRQTARDGHRLRDRRRRVRDAFAGRPLTRDDPRRRARTFAPMFACAAAPSPPTCRRTAPSADLARRNAFSRSNAIWTASRKPSASRPRNCAAAISFTRARRSPSAKWSAKKSIWTS